MNNEELFEREEKCQKAIRTVSKAIFMRLFATAVLLWALIASGLEGWAIGLIVLVMIINLAGTLPLVSEWKKQRMLLKKLITQEE